MMRLLARVLLALGAVGIMYVEGQHQPSPGVGFAVAMFMMIMSVMPWTERGWLP
jgi:hypothetical protein